MSDRLAGAAEGFLSSLGRAFFISGYIPALYFVAFNQYIILGPLLAKGTPLNLFQQINNPLLGFIEGQTLTVLLIPIVLGILMLALNTVLIQFYAGLLPFQKILLFPFYRMKLARHRKIYANLDSQRDQYRELAGSEDPSNKRDLRLAITIQHEGAEDVSRQQILPRSIEKVAPTSLGNAFAIIEDYPYERYGMDGVLFWPRIRPLISENYQAILDTQKISLDMLLNLSLASAVLGLESIILALTQPSGGALIWIVATAGLLLSWLFYRSGVAAARSMVPIITKCFDIYRGQLLQEYGLELPDNIEDEYRLWLRLAAFIRRGEPFYFPKK